MVQERTAGNGNFDIDAITRLMAEPVDGVGNQPRGSYTELLDNMDRAEATRLGLDDPSQVAIINDIKIMIDDMQADRSAGSGSDLEAALVSGIVARLPAGMSSAAANAIMLEVERRDRTDGGRSFNNEVWDRIKEEVKRERQAQNDNAEMADKMDDIAQQRQAQQQRAEVWASSDHTYAGQKMSADEWLRMIQWFRQPENRAMWEDAMMITTGQTREEVRIIGDKIDRLDELIEKESRGETLTPEEEAEKERLNNDRDVQEGMRLRREQMELAGRLQPQVSNRVDAQAATISSEATAETATVGASLDVLAGGNVSGATTLSRTSLSAEVEGQGEFAATAPSLRANFVAANAATEVPLDQPAPQIVASVAPVEARVIASGMDV